SEQLGFQQSIGKSRTAYLDQGLQPSRRSSMNGVSNDFLPRSAIARNENSGRTWCNLLDHAYDVSHFAAGIDDPAWSALVQLLAQVTVFARQVLLLGSLFDGT